MSTYHFPDVNVWLALAHKVHPHHEIAVTWGRNRPRGSRFYFCRFTQLGLLRLLTNQSVMGADTASQVDAWAIYDQFYDNGATYLSEEPPGVEQGLRKKTSRSTSSGKEWGDSYLSAFAASAGFGLVTFDRALAKRTPGSSLLAPGN